MNVKYLMVNLLIYLIIFAGVSFLVGSTHFIILMIFILFIFLLGFLSIRLLSSKKIDSKPRFSSK